MKDAPTARRRPIFAALVLMILVFAGDALAQGLPRPRITTPRLNQQIGSAVVGLRWTGVRGARSYRLRVREAGARTWWIDQPTRGTSHSFRPSDHGAFGARFEMYVYACANGDGTNCGDYSETGAYVLGPPVVLSGPSDGYTYSGSDRRPEFSWQPYTGLKPSSGGGTVSYSITFSGNGGSPQTFTTQSTSFRPPQAINPAFRNPVRWSVRACKSYNCSGTARPRTLNLGGSSFGELAGDVSYSQPSNGAQVDVGSQLRWNTKPGAATYRICLNMYSSGCRIIREQRAQSGSIQSYTLTDDDLDAGPPFGQPYFRGKTMYWGITACTAGNTSCVSTPVPHRSVQVAAAAPVAGGGAVPTVSFAQHLYPTIASNSCNSCHGGGNYYPQRTDRPAICSVPSCGTTTIPFNTSISAATMRQRFLCLKACSQQTQYSQALGKVYVVPGVPSQSGLHHKARESTAGAFGANLTIAGVTKSVREWITMWIEQGANP